MSLAMHGYHDQHGRLPPAVVYGTDGQPLLSWRVLILPFIEQKDLYDQFKLDEPWDSPHNIQLLPQMPSSFKSRPSIARKIAENHTICHAFVGKGTAFEPGAVLNFKRDFPNGTSNTIMLVEAGKPVPWTKPENLIYDPDGPLPELWVLHKTSFRVALVDGSVRYISKRMSEATFRAAIVRNGSMVGPDWNDD